jgi:PEGA domain
MSRVIAFLACGFTLAACSSSLPSMDFFKSSPTTEALRIESEPPGAEAKTTNGQSCRTPCELSVQSGTDLTVTVALNGYQPQTVPLRPESGNAGKLAPNPVYVDLQATPPVTPKKKKPAAKKRKPATTAAATAPAPAPSTTAAVPPPDTAPAPAPVEPSATSTTSYPWPSR